MTSSSRNEPPGWITAVAPSVAATSSPSRGRGRVAGAREGAPLLLGGWVRWRRAGPHRGGEGDPNEAPRRRLDDGGVQDAVDPDDTAVDRDRIRRLGQDDGGAHRRRAADTTRVRVLDDDGRRLLELEQERECGREVEQVVVAELRTVELLHGGEAHGRRADLT